MKSSMFTLFRLFKLTTRYCYGGATAEVVCDPTMESLRPWIGRRDCLDT